MAKTVITTDDLDGSPDAETVEFSFDGADYAIDLSKKNTTAFKKAIKPYLDAARKEPRRPRVGQGRRRKRGSGNNLGAIREWATEHGIDVAPRGRIPQSVVEQYNAAH